ncbi:MAG TPA: hypothetical protein PLR28_03875 [Dokdonella sp.]|nr:hypothetical protein [Dokdonella sp.]
MNELTQEQIAELRKGAIKSILPEIKDFSRANLVELLAQESQEANPRETLVAAVTDRIAAIDADDDAVDAEAAEANAPVAPAYQALDYNGPLTIDQAQWRHANLKPAEVAETK